MIGIIVNVLAIVIGGGLGCIIRGKFPVKIQRIILQCVGLASLLLGISGLITNWFVDSKVSLEVDSTLLVLFALFIGTLLGDALRVEGLLDKLGCALSRLDKTLAPAEPATGAAKGRAPAAPRRRDAIRRARQAGKGEAISPPAQETSTTEEAPARWWQISKLPTYDLPDLRTGNRFADGFVLATLLCAVSAPVFSGTIAAGVDGEPEQLFYKAIFDAVLVLALASIYGMGALFGSLSVLVIESNLFAASYLWSDFMTPTITGHFGVIAAVITIGVGINLSFGRKWKVANVIPALLISPIYTLIVDLATDLIGK